MERMRREKSLASDSLEPEVKDALDRLLDEIDEAYVQFRGGEKTPGLLYALGFWQKVCRYWHVVRKAERVDG